MISTSTPRFTAATGEAYDYTMTVDTRIFTADELLRLPDDGWRYELVEGELRRMSPAGAKHGAIIARILVRLGSHVEAHGLGQVYSSDTGFVLARNPDTVLAPDVGYVGRERVVENDEFFPGPPDVAFEVISPSDRYTEVEEKKDRYLSAGTPAVVVVDPRRLEVQVHRTSGVTNVTDTLTIDDLLPGWSMTLDDIFTTAR
ncbi:MAG TPA: Uma2 family endonuclease [Thermoanaerobaculia bacterium]|nr:Uma2 family endonuclease [Thermoanaerobaculia bacterium]